IIPFKRAIQSHQICNFLPLSTILLQIPMVMVEADMVLEWEWFQV
ncbi:hypothetical protein GCK32_019446, partial [Trichostrongylus colubriformis]